MSLTKFVNTYTIIHENQAGFRKIYSTADHSFTMNILIDYMKSCKTKLYVAFIDCSRAFDTVSRSKLFQKLVGYNINAKFLQLIKNMYSNIKYCIQTSRLSPFFSCENVLGQSENLSPLLFFSLFK